MAQKRLPSKMSVRKKKPVVFFDFDNTITPFDVFDDMVARFSRDESWVALEKRWEKGEIGSRQCLEGQLRGIKVEESVLHDYLSGVPLDPYFKKIIAFLDRKGIQAYILSDNFDFFLKRILRHHGVTKIPVYCNKARFARGRFSPNFPYVSKKCPTCAHCKTKNLLANARRDSIIFYIGDGRSDICPAKEADLVFAKGKLLEFCRKNSIPHRAHRTLKQVYDYFMVQESMKHFPTPLRKSPKVIAGGNSLERSL